jgi:tRNA dimethylallyltransferase
MASANRLLAIVGATGTGKSQLSLEMAQGIRERGGQAEIINADAMQLYRGMDIGTAKVSLTERALVAHHMFDVLDVTQEASVADYQRDARAVIDDVLARGATPILVGGSGLYVSSVLFEFDFPGHDDAIRARLEDELEQVGPGLMSARLKELAPEAAERIDSQNARRVVRALEVIEITGSPAALGTLPEEAVYWRPTSMFELREDREVLVERLDRRVEAMWARGMLDEVHGLIPQGIERGVTARRAIGYAQALAQLEGALTEAEAIEETQSLTRRYARRQVSWFKRYANAAVLSAGAVGNAERILASL